jgi:hypothetical protein
MKTSSTHFWFIKVTILFLLLACFLPKVKAQTNAYLTFSCKDSLLADDKSAFVYNHATIVNTFSQVVSFNCTIDVPAGWSLLSQNNIFIQLSPGESYPLSITLNRLKYAASIWKDVKIKLCLKNTHDTSYYSFVVKTNPITNFRARAVIRDITVNDKTKEVELPIRILNTGNVLQQYVLHYANEKINLQSDIKILLQPGKDTVYNYKLKLPDRIKKQIIQEEIFLTITGAKDKIGLYSFLLSRTSSYRKINKSAFETFPFTFETGVLTINNQYTGYFAFDGAYPFKKDYIFSFNYHSKQFGIESVQQNNINVGLVHKKWGLQVGQISEIGPFVNFGTGFKIIYNKSLEEGVSLFANKSNLSFINAINFGVATKFKIKKVQLFQEIVGNFDKQKNRNSFIQDNKITIVNTKKMLIDANVGVGFSADTKLSKFELPNTSGYSVGYHFRDMISKKLVLKSSVQINSDAFPGNFQGYRLQLHNIKWQPTKNIYFGVEFQSTFFKKSFFKDSIFYRSQLLSNNKQYGINTGFSLFKKIGIDIGGGIMKNAVIETNNSPEYKFGTFGLNFTLFKKLSFNANTLVGYNSSLGLQGQDLLLYTVNAGLNCPFGGVQILYDQIPFFVLNGKDQVFSNYQHTLNVGPYLNKSFFRDHLEARLQYNYSKALPEELVLENGALSLAYLNQKTGWNVQFSASTSVNTNTPYKFGMLTIRKKLFLPKIHSRKAYDLKIVLFNDENNDAQKNNNEDALKNVEININSLPYITSEKGIIFIDNTDKGMYEMDFHTIKGLNGLIPAAGFKQSILLEKNNTFYIPFKKGKSISGNVFVTLDTFSNQKFSPDRLKVIVTDSAGEKFTTLTNAKGYYSLGVPAGKYVVTLNPAAFDDVFKPVQMAFSVDLMKAEEIKVNFEIRQRQRKVVRVKSDIKNL